MRFVLSMFLVLTMTALPRFSNQVYGQNPFANALPTDPEAVLNRAIEAIGGQKRIESIKAFRMTSRIVDTRKGQDRCLKEVLTAQNSRLIRLRSETKDFLYNSILGIKDDSGWVKNELLPKQPVETMSKAYAFQTQLELEMVVVPLTLIELKSDKFKLELRGSRAYRFSTPNGLLSGTAQVVKVTRLDNESFLLMFDWKTGLLVKQIGLIFSPFGDLETSNYFTEYKDFNGLKIATVVYGKELEESEYYTKTILDYEPLEDLDLKLFDKPE